jgi:carboxylesterase
VAEGIGLSRRLPEAFGVPAAALAEHRRLLQAARSALKTVSQPTLIVHTREDCCAGLDSAGYLQRNLRGLVDMVVLGGGAQAARLDGRRDLIVEKAVAFAETVANRASAASGRQAGAPVVVLKAKAS